MNDNTLLISYFFPPFKGGGVNRIRNLHEFMKKKDIPTYVLTARPEYYPYWEVDSVVDVENIVRTKVFLGKMIRRELGRNSSGSGIRFKKLKKFLKDLLVPDEQLLWIPYALMPGIRIVKKSNVKMLISSGPPFTNHLLAYLISKLSDSKYVLDYRDLWNGNPVYTNSNVLSRTVSFALEKRIARGADKIVVTTEEARKRFLDTFGVKDAYVVENGYEFTVPGNGIKYPFLSRKGPLKLFYSGSLSQKRTPAFFLQAVKDLKARCNLEVHFLGFTDERHKLLVNELGLRDRVFFRSNVSPDLSVRTLAEEADILLLFQRSSEGGQWAIPGKLYEYLTLHKPILCMDDPGGAVTSFLAKFDIPAVGYEDVRGIHEWLVQAYESYESLKDSFRRANEEIKNCYHRDELNKRFLQIVRSRCK
jgi:glycosyltransferase involved in cell wall biosynthesis